MSENTGDGRVSARVEPGVLGPGAIAASLLFTTALQRAEVDSDTRARILKALGDTVPLRPVRPGAAGQDRTLPAEALTLLVPSAAVVAAGLDPAKVSRPVPPVLWSEGANRLLVRVGEVSAELLYGAVVLTVPVMCDQTGPTEVTVSFLTGTPDAPTGGVVTTEDHPRGPSTVVETWAEPLVAFAWHILVVATGSLSGAGGNDIVGRGLIAADVAVSDAGITVTPQARHTFLTGVPT